MVIEVVKEDQMIKSIIIRLIIDLNFSTTISVTMMSFILSKMVNKNIFIWIKT